MVWASISGLPLLARQMMPRAQGWLLSHLVLNLCFITSRCSMLLLLQFSIYSLVSKMQYSAMVAVLVADSVILVQAVQAMFACGVPCTCKLALRLYQQGQQDTEVQLPTLSQLSQLCASGSNRRCRACVVIAPLPLASAWLCVGCQS